MSAQQQYSESTRHLEFSDVDEVTQAPMRRGDIIEFAGFSCVRMTVPFTWLTRKEHG